MSEFLRSIVARLRARVADRRSAPRHASRLPCAVYIHDPKRAAAARPDRAARLEAFTRDLSSTGLAVVAPAVRIGDRYLTDSALRVILEHADGPVELFASAVRYEQLEAGDAGGGGGGAHGYLIGLRISSIADDDRARYDELLRQPR